MLKRVLPILGAVALALATTAWAQSEFRGVVNYVDPNTRTIYFTDGRIVQLKPGATLLINGQPVMFESVRPGTALVMLEPGATSTTVTTVTQQTQVAAPAPLPVPAPLPAPSPVNVTGTIARVDPMSQTITFQDGRTVKVVGQTMMWQQTPAVSSLQPGMQVFVSNAIPVGYVPSTTYTSSGSTVAPSQGQWMMGTVSRVDPTAHQVFLSDGTRVYVGPTTTYHMGSQPTTLSRLRTGDEIVIHTRPAAVTATPVYTTAPANVTVTTSGDRYAGSALPYQSYADSRIEASDVQILWSPQAR